VAVFVGGNNNCDHIQVIRAHVYEIFMIAAQMKKPPEGGLKNLGGPGRNRPGYQEFLSCL
jgi:hypothetical protein